MVQPICLITGVGEGTGTAIATRFHQGGYQVAMIARNQERLHQLERTLSNARAYTCDVGNLEALSMTLSQIQSEMGEPAVPAGAE